MPTHPDETFDDPKTIHDMDEFEDVMDQVIDIVEDEKFPDRGLSVAALRMFEFFIGRTARKTAALERIAMNLEDNANLRDSILQEQNQILNNIHAAIHDLHLAINSKK